MPRTILFLNTPPYLGGAEISLLTLMANLDKARHSSILLTSAEGPLAKRAREMQIRVMIQDFPWFSRRKPWQYGLSVYRLYQTVCANKIMLIQVNCDRGITFARQVSRLTGVPYIAYVRDVVRDWFAPAALRALRHSRRVLTNSSWMAQRCQEAGIAAEQLTVVYPPVDVAAFATVMETTLDALRQEFHLLPEQIVLGVVGQIHPLKGQLEFVQAAIQVARVIPQAMFFIIGAALSPELAVYEQQLRAVVAQAGWSKRFHFTGFRKDVVALMHLCDIVVASSPIEAFGRVVVEGMAAGGAVIGTSSGGIPEIVEHERDGLLVPPKDIAALTEAMLRLCDDVGLRTALGHTAIEKAQQFSIERHVTQMRFLYDSLLWVSQKSANQSV